MPKTFKQIPSNVPKETQPWAREVQTTINDLYAQIELLNAQIVELKKRR